MQYFPGNFAESPIARPTWRGQPLARCSFFRVFLRRWPRSFLLNSRGNEQPGLAHGRNIIPDLMVSITLSCGLIPFQVTGHPDFVYLLIPLRRLDEIRL